MKNISILILLSILLISCSKKTHILNGSKISNQTKSSNDSSGQKKTEIIDRSIVTIDKSIDTNIIITGKLLTGYINPALYTSKDSVVSSLFENNDVSLYLEANKKTGLIKAIATPKPKKAAIKIHEKVTFNNDVRTIESVKSNLKTRIDTKADSTRKQVTDHADPIMSAKSLGELFIVLIIILGVIGITYFLVKKFNIISLITGWAKK